MGHLNGTLDLVISKIEVFGIFRIIQIFKNRRSWKAESFKLIVKICEKCLKLFKKVFENAIQSLPNMLKIVKNIEKVNIQIKCLKR